MHGALMSHRESAFAFGARPDAKEITVRVHCVLTIRVRGEHMTYEAAHLVREEHLRANIDARIARVHHNRET